MTVPEILDGLAEKLGGRASVSTVFGEPVAHGDVVVIPVARAGFGLGAGAGKVGAEAAKGSGGGGGTSVRPVGYIEIKNGGAVFRPIRGPLVEFLVPAASIVAAALAPRIARRLIRLRRALTSGAGGP